MTFLDKIRTFRTNGNHSDAKGIYDHGDRGRRYVVANVRPPPLDVEIIAFQLDMVNGSGKGVTQHGDSYLL
jgi:hypothetical protein